MSKKTKVAIIGANGQLGFDLARSFRPDFEVIEFTIDDFDVSDAPDVEKMIAKAKPSLVINTAAFHNTEECERNPAKSFSVNAVGAWNVARAAQAAGARVGYISTHYVFYCS